MYIQHALTLTLILYFIYLLSTGHFKVEKKTYTRRFESDNYHFFFLIIMVYMVFVRTFVMPSSVSDILGYERALNDVSRLPWNKIGSDSMDVDLEIGYYVVLKLFSYLSTDINFFLLFQAIISQILLYRILKKYSASPFISLIVYMVMMFCPSIYILRQYFAMLILFNSLDAVINRRFFPFVLYILIASSIHKVAIIFFPLYFLYGIKSKIRLLITLILIFVILKLSFSALYYYFGDSVFGGYDGYLYSNKYEGSNLTESIIDLCFVFAYVFFAKNHILDIGLDRLLFISVFLAFSISFAGTSLPLVGRLALFYAFSVVLVIPRIMSYIKTPLIRYSFVIVVLLFLHAAFFHDNNMYTYRLIF